MRVLAIDPGPHVGVAYWTDKAITDLLANGSPGEGSRYTEEWREWEETPASLYEFIEDWIAGTDVVVCEDFFISGARASEANVTVEMIGVLRYLAGRAGKVFVTQPPADAKGFSTTSKLKNIGWYKPAPTDHARSATRHLLLFLVKHNHIAGDRVLESAAEEV